MSDIIPPFIKVYTTAIEARVRFEGSTGDQLFLPASLGKSVDMGGGSVPDGFVVLSILNKGVKSADDTITPPTLSFGAKLSKMIGDGNNPLKIGVGVDPDTPIATGDDLVIPRFTRFNTNTSWR